MVMYLIECKMFFFDKETIRFIFVCFVKLNSLSPMIKLTCSVIKKKDILIFLLVYGEL